MVFVFSGRSVPFLCRVYSYLPWYRHVLPGTLIIPSIPAGIDRPPPTEAISHVTPSSGPSNTLSGTTRLLLLSDEGPCE